MWLLHFYAVLMASVNSSGSGNAGEIFTLICSITRAENISGNVILQWIGPPVTSMDAFNIGDPVQYGATTTLSLVFTSLFTSHGGEYTCQADLAFQDTMYTISALQDVIVRGMYD